MISPGALNDSSNDSSHLGDPHMVRVSSPRDHGDDDDDDDDEEEEDDGDDYDLIVATNDDIYDNIEMPAALQGRRSVLSCLAKKIMFILYYSERH